METVLFYGVLYLLITLIFLFMTAIIRGFQLSHLILEDVIDSLIWPFSIGILIGLIIKIITNNKTKTKTKD